MAKYTKEMFVRDGFDKYITNEWDVVAASSAKMKLAQETIIRRARIRERIFFILICAP